MMKTGIIKTSIALGCLSVMTATSALARDVEEMRDLEAFTAIAIAGGGRIEIKVGDEQSVKIRADEEAIEHVTTTVSGGELEIEPERGAGRYFRRSRSSFDVYITVPSLDSVVISGSGRSRIENISSDNFTYEVNGSGRAYLSGTCGDGKFEMHGSGRLDAEDLTCTNAEISAVGSGGIDMTVTGDVEIDTVGSGGITIRGGARLRKMTGRGSGGVNIIEE